MIKSRVLENVLEKKGFKKKPGDHNYYYFYIRGIRTNIKTKTSHGSSGHSGREIDNYLEKKIREQLHLSKEQFKLLYDCPLKEEDLVEIYTTELNTIDSKIKAEIEKLSERDLLPN
jgi:hypothetical protein